MHSVEPTGRLAQVSGLFGLFRWGFMPLGLFALVSVGVHAAADVIDEHLLTLVDGLDAWADARLAAFEATAAWVDRVGPFERTVVARALALAWELAVAVLVAAPQLGYRELNEVERRLSWVKDAWRAPWLRLLRAPTPARLLRPAVTAVFAAGGAYALARLVEATLFVTLQSDVASPPVAEAVARGGGWVALALVVGRLGWRAVLRALEHADAACEAALKRAAPAWPVGLVGAVVALPLAVALVLQSQALLALVR